jgi:hypothetical protein
MKALALVACLALHGCAITTHLDERSKTQYTQITLLRAQW